MDRTYRLFGNELSPYSVKVRSYLRFKGIPHEWIIRSPATEEEFQRYAKLPLIPLLITPEGRGLQDSTPIIETLERRQREPEIVPADPRLAFVSSLLEEYADEWVNKPMFHYRWFYETDARSAAERLAASVMPDVEPSAAVQMISKRMVSRLSFVGSSAETRETIEASFLRLVDYLEQHLRHRPYLLGQRPALADFGLFGQLYECATDPTPGAILRQRGPHILEWLQRMQSPRLEGDFEPFEVLGPALLPLLKEEIGETFLPWTLANEAALAVGQQEFQLMLQGRPFRQSVQKYHAKSLAALREKYRATALLPDLDELLKRAGCKAALLGGTEAQQP